MTLVSLVLEEFSVAAPKKSGLGRGLGELFQRTDPAEPEVSRETPQEPVSRETSGLGGDDGHVAMPNGAAFSEIPVEAITPNPHQPRSVFDDDALTELAESIEEIGVLQPIIVRQVPNEERYELVMGERRWRASQQAGKDTIPAIIRPTEQHEMLRHALLENLHRVQLNPLEEAAAYQQLLDDFSCTQEELSQRIKRSRSQIANTIRLLKLPPTVQRRVAAGVLSAGHARALLGLPDTLSQEQLAQRIVAEGLSVRATEEIVTLWDSRTPTSGAGRGARDRSPRAVELSEYLSDYFETRARVDIGKRKGKITIEFSTLDDLDRILAIINQQPADKAV